MRIAIVILLALPLGGCFLSAAPATVDAECKVFTDPGFAVQGKRLQDKQWIGRTQEVGIAVCGWGRPKK